MSIARLGLRYGMVLLLLGLILASIGYNTSTVAIGAGRDYEKALLEFAGAERTLGEAIQDLQIGAVRHFDELSTAVQALRRAESALATVPGHVDTAMAFNEMRLQLSVMVNERIAQVETFKTNLAALQVSLDALPDVIAGATPEAASLGEDTQGLVPRVVGSLARLAQDPGTTLDEQLGSELAALAAAAGEETSASYHAGLAGLARQGELIRARRKALDSVVLSMSSLPLPARTFDLVELYHRADLSSRWRTAWILAGITAVLILGLFALFTVYLARARRDLGVALAQQIALKEGMKEARGQAASQQRGEKEQAALLAEERHNALVQHAFDLMAILSRQENYIHVSPASMAFFGLTEKEMIGKSVYEGIHADDIIKVQDYLARAQRELQTEQTIQYRMMDAYGKWHLLETFASNQASNPAVRGMVLNTRRLDAAPDPRTR